MADNQFLLQRFKHVNATDTDISEKVQLESKRKNLVNFDVIQSVNVAEQFEIERQNSLQFKIYGGLEFYAPLSNMPSIYGDISAFFNKQIPSIISPKTVHNSFDVYLVRPYTGNTVLTSTKSVKKYEVIATPSDIDIIDAGFSRNIFFEKKQIYMCSENIDLYDRTDAFGKPIMEVYLFFNYKTSTSLSVETFEKKVFDSSSTETIFTKTPYTYTTYDKGDIIESDLINYEKENFLEETINNQEYYITVQYLEGSTTKHLRFKYNPFIKIQLRNFGNENIMANVSATTVETIIPPYAVKLDDNGNYLWREILDFGYVDPIDGIGNNFPFVNGTHYVHKNIILSMTPDMTHSNTNIVFSDIEFAGNQLINTTPSNNLNNSGIIC